MSTSSFVFGTEDQSPFQITGRREIIKLLQGIVDHREQVTLAFHGGSEMLLSRLIEIDEKHDRIYIDCSQNPGLNDRIAESDGVAFETALERIRILFSAKKVSECQHGGETALCTPIPTTLIRLQRREFFRVNIPLNRLVECRFTLPGGTYNLPLADISCGGIAILDEQHLLNTSDEIIYSGCRIDLGESGHLDLSLKVCSSLDVALPTGKTIRRLGCQFYEMQPGGMTIVQRYIMQLERERNARLHSLK